MDLALLKSAMACKCPRCGKGDLYKRGTIATVADKCGACGLTLARNDSGDGPAVFLIFILGFTVVPLVLLLELLFTPPLWVHAIAATALALGGTLALLRPLKSYVIALQFKVRGLAQ